MTERVPEIYSLTGDELAWVDQEIRTLPGGWNVEVIRDPGEFSVVLLPADGDRFAATFLIHRVREGYRLMASSWDELSAVGVFPGLTDAFAHVAAAAATAARLAPFPNLH
jgi:hypothetical protein